MTKDDQAEIEALEEEFRDDEASYDAMQEQNRTQGLSGVVATATATNEPGAIDVGTIALNYRVDPLKLRTLEDVVYFIGLAGFHMNDQDPNYPECKQFLKDESIEVSEYGAKV